MFLKLSSNSLAYFSFVNCSNFKIKTAFFQLLLSDPFIDIYLVLYLDLYLFFTLLATSELVRYFFFLLEVYGHFSC